MIRRSPAEYYIKYLMLLPDKLSDEDIARTLRENQLDYPGAPYLRRLRASLKPPIPFRPMVETDLPSYKFLQKHKVHRLFFRDKHVDGALELLAHPKGKEVVESMLLVDEQPFSIVQRLRRFGIHVTLQMVSYYEHFFMNVKLVDPTEMRALILVRVEDMLLQGDDKETIIRYKAMKQAMYNDPRYMAATTTQRELAQMKLQMRHGLMLTRVDYGRLAENIRQAALVAANEAVNSNDPKAAERAKDLAAVAVAMDSMLRDRGGGENEMNKGLSAIALKTDPDKPPSIKSLTDGNFTDSVYETSVEASNDE